MHPWLLSHCPLIHFIVSTQFFLQAAPHACHFRPMNQRFSRQHSTSTVHLHTILEVVCVASVLPEPAYLCYTAQVLGRRARQVLSLALRCLTMISPGTGTRGLAIGNPALPVIHARRLPPTNVVLLHNTPIPIPIWHECRSKLGVGQSHFALRHFYSRGMTNR